MTKKGVMQRSLFLIDLAESLPITGGIFNAKRESFRRELFNIRSYQSCIYHETNEMYVNISKKMETDYILLATYFVLKLFGQTSMFQNGICSVA